MSPSQTISNLIVLAVLILSAAVSKTTSLTISFSKNFTSLEKDRRNLIFGENSTIFKNAIQVTGDTTGEVENQAGRVVYKKKFRLWTSPGNNSVFNTTFVLNIKNRAGPPGEGLAFILTNSSEVPQDSYGKWLGIVSPYGGSNTVAIEFDTRKSGPEDMDDNHIGMDINSIISRRQFHLGYLKLSSGNDITVNIDYDGATLSVFMQTSEIKRFMVISEEIDLSAYLPNHVFVGFSGSTGNLTQLNCVRFWSFHGSDEERNVKKWVIIGAPFSVAVLFVVCFIIWRSCRNLEKDDYSNIEIPAVAPIRFKLKDLQSATRNFRQENELGKGGCGIVYKGEINNKKVAVKRILKDGKKEFLAEITTIGHLNHRNLIKLIGWCHEKRDLLLVCEFMSNGSLDKFIFNPNPNKTLSWKTRWNIISGVAHAVNYLHNECKNPVLHRDLKSSNVLLDSDFTAKLGDFGLARIIGHETDIAGTMGYMAPELFTGCLPTEKTDVYAFGVLILEICCGRKPISIDEQDAKKSSYIVHWVWDLHARNEIIQAADKRLNGIFNLKDMKDLLALGLTCCHPDPEERPLMNVVLRVLNGEAPVPGVQLDRPRLGSASLNYALLSTE